MTTDDLHELSPPARLYLRRFGGGLLLGTSVLERVAPALAAAVGETMARMLVDARECFAFGSCEWAAVHALLVASDPEGCDGLA